MCAVLPQTATERSGLRSSAAGAPPNAHRHPRSGPTLTPSWPTWQDWTPPRLPSSGGPGLSRPLPLADIRVLAFTHVAAGPYATLQLAALGADVIKVESRSRIDLWRWDKNRDPERSARFIDHNKNARSVTLNLKTPEGRALAMELAAKSDVVVENFAAGVLERLGLGWDVLSKDHPELILVHMSGLGSTGPRSQYVTYGPSVMAVSGMTHLWNHPEREEPVGSQTSYPDYLVGAYAAYAIVAALIDRDVDGHGRELDLIQLHVVETAMGSAVVAAANELTAVGPQGDISDAHVPYGCYPCAGGDDDWCVISVATDEQWQGLVRTMVHPGAADPRFATEEGRRAHRAEIDAVVADWTRGRSAREVMERCQANGAPAGIVATGRDLSENPSFAERGFLLEMEHVMMGPVRLPGPPMRLGHDRLEIWRLGPTLGEDNDYVLGEVLGRSPDEIAKLEADGVVA
ncbi:MAG: CoA transferase [Myxococcales bacterium]|nr:CoA transferase [Myxococcales bacterium]